MSRDRCSRCSHSRAGERPRGAAGADGRHGRLRLQTAVPSVRLVGHLEEVKAARERERAADPGRGHNPSPRGP